ncbi:MAG: recombinase family protein [Bacilli bacterium]|nr:recombinase family protein [Bacilli bacterium]
MNLYEIRQKLNMGYNLKDIRLRVTFYSRVSTDHNEQKNSLSNQSEHFKKIIKANRNWEYVEGYVDDGITGMSVQKRDSFKRMIIDSKNNKFDLIITKEISRFSRNTLDSIKYTRELLNNGVAVLFYNDNINTIFPDSELRLTIMASMAQDEVRRLSERVKFGMKRAQEKGVMLGNNQIYGYKINKEQDKLIVLEDEAKVIKKIFNMYIEKNLSFNKISKVLNKENIKTKFEKKWNPSQISRIITNPKYKGYFCARKKEVIDYMNKRIKINEKDKWIIYKDEERIPVIIEEKIWNKANKKLSKKNKKEK